MFRVNPKTVTRWARAGRSRRSGRSAVTAGSALGDPPFLEQVEEHEEAVTDRRWPLGRR